MKPWHVTISSRSRLPLFPDPWRRRQALRKLMDVAGAELALFCIVDEHVHTVPVCDEATLERRRRGLTRLFRSVAAVEVNPAHVKPIEDRDHMLNVFDYVLRQPEKHGLPGHPALWPGSCLPDLLGARLLPGLQLRILDVLPRAQERDALAAVQLPIGRLIEPTAQQVRMLGVQRVALAASAVFAAQPSLNGLGKLDVRARRLACHVARLVGLPTLDMASCLGIDPRSVRRLAASPIDSREPRALLRRLALEDVVARNPR